MRVRLSSILFLIYASASLAAPAREAGAEVTLSHGNSAAIIDETTDFGLFSWSVDNRPSRVFQQWFWFRAGSEGPEAPINTLTPDPGGVTPIPDGDGDGNPDGATMVFGSASFKITVTWRLVGGGAGSHSATLSKTVTVANLTTQPLDFHLFHYSDFDLNAQDTIDNTVVIDGSRVIQTDRRGVTLTQSASPLPFQFDIDASQASLLPALTDELSSTLSGFAGPWPVDDDMSFALQWDLAVPAGGSASVNIEDRLVPTFSPTLALTRGGGCLEFGKPFTYELTLDNSVNTLSLSSGRIDLPLPSGIGFVEATEGWTFDPTTSTVSWQLGSVPGGASRAPLHVTAIAGSSFDFAVEGRFVSDNAYPAFASDTALLCNHPPFFSSSPATAVAEGSAYRYQVVAGDTDAGTSLAYALDAGPPGMAISASGEVTWSPPFDAVGTHPVRVSVSDGALSASQDFTLRVNAGPPDGDVNGDRIVNLADAILALRIVVGIEAGTPARLAHGDVAPQASGRPAPNQILTIQDVLFILKKSLGLLNW